MRLVEKKSEEEKEPMQSGILVDLPQMKVETIAWVDSAFMHFPREKLQLKQRLSFP